MTELVDLTFRDGHQSKLATRLRTEDMKPLMKKMDQVGFHATEVWGGATFDACIRYLNEDPWERLQTFNEQMPNTKLMMLERAMNIVAYQNYPDDIVKKFIELAHKNGIDVFRIFDALNDLRNMKIPMDKAKEVGAEVQASLCYTESPVHSPQTYAEKFKKLEEMGADSLCIKDMAGIISPDKAHDIIKRSKEEGVTIPIDLHSHTTSGMALMAFQKALDAGVDMVDTVFSPLANGTSHPPTETVYAALQNTEHDPEYDWELLMELREEWMKVWDKYNHLHREKAMITDPSVLTHKIPGGMLSNLMSQLEQAGIQDKYYEVLEEVPKVREELGYPPLVTPASQIVGTQATMNVKLGERYKQIPQQVKEYVKGMYGKPPGKINKKIKEKVLGKNYQEKIIEDRPANHLKPQYKKNKKKLKKLGVLKKEEDILTYTIYPEQGLKFLKNKAKPEFTSKELPKPKKMAGSKKEYLIKLNDKEYSTKVWKGK